MTRFRALRQHLGATPWPVDFFAVDFFAPEVRFDRYQLTQAPDRASVLASHARITRPNERPL